RVAQHEPDRPGTGILAVAAAWQRAVDALLHVQDPLEVWYVLANRHTLGVDGSTLRTGWLTIGRAATATHAIRIAEAAVHSFHAIQSSALPFVTLGFIRDAASMLDLLMPGSAAFAQAIRRDYWTLPLAIPGPGNTEALPAVPVLVPWRV